MKNPLIVILMAVLTITARAARAEPVGQERFNTVAQWTANALIVADWLQTRHIANDPAYIENNRDLGPYPSSGAVNRYFVQSIVVYNALGYLLPARWRGMFWVGVAAHRAAYVIHNAQIGIRMEF